MKAKFIAINWCLSFIGLSVDTERSSLLMVLVMIAWFTISSLLFIHADKKGWFDHIYKNNKKRNHEKS